MPFEEWDIVCWTQRWKWQARVFSNRHEMFVPIMTFIYYASHLDDVVEMTMTSGLGRCASLFTWLAWLSASLLQMFSLLELFSPFSFRSLLRRWYFLESLVRYIFELSCLTRWKFFDGGFKKIFSHFNLLRLIKIKINKNWMRANSK